MGAVGQEFTELKQARPRPILFNDRLPGLYCHHRESIAALWGRAIDLVESALGSASRNSLLLPARRTKEHLLSRLPTKAALVSLIAVSSRSNSRILPPSVSAGTRRSRIVVGLVVAALVRNLVGV